MNDKYRQDRALSDRALKVKKKKKIVAYLRLLTVVLALKAKL